MTSSNDYIGWRKDKPNYKIWWGDIYHGISERDVRAGEVSADELDAAA